MKILVVALAAFLFSAVGKAESSSTYDPCFARCDGCDHMYEDQSDACKERRALLLGSISAKQKKAPPKDSSVKCALGAPTLEACQGCDKKYCYSPSTTRPYFQNSMAGGVNNYDTALALVEKCNSAAENAFQSGRDSGFCKGQVAGICQSRFSGSSSQTDGTKKPSGAP